MKRIGSLLLFVLALLIVHAPTAAALDRLCDPANEDCRALLLSRIQNETVGIDVGFWFMEDARYTSALAAASRRGVRVRVLVDPRANSSDQFNAARLDELQSAGIPMRKNVGSAILHYKMMLFAGQAVVEFSGANYSADAWVYSGTQPYLNYTDESVYFTDDPSIVQSFMSKFDSLWIDTVRYADYANVVGAQVRAYPVYPISPDLNFPPADSYATRALAAYAAEQQAIDVIMFRITDQRHTNAMIAALGRGVPVRLISEPDEYRDAARLWDAWNVDRMYAAGIPIRMRAHAGLSHQKLVLLHGSGTAIFGSSNWTSPSDHSQEEHNYFATKLDLFTWFDAQFERKWTNAAGVAETVPFTPLPPDQPTIVAPSSNAIGVPESSVTLKWYGGPWAHRYDVYLGTTTSNLQPISQDNPLGPSESVTQYQSVTVANLTPGTTYYWKVVSRTMAGKTASGPTWAFTTAGTAPSQAPPAPSTTTHTAGPGDIVLYATDGHITGTAWTLVTDTTTAGGSRLLNPDHAAAKVAAPVAAPASFVDFTFAPVAGQPYHLWIRAQATANDYRNDSFYAQFSNAVDASGRPIDAIGTTGGEAISLEDCSGIGVSGWGWQDDLYCGLAQPLVFKSSGPVTLRLQQREDGVAIDEILLSADTFLSASPGALKNDANVYVKASAALPVTSTPPPTPTTSGEIVLYASDGLIKGAAWSLTADATAAGGSRLWNPDRGAAKVAAAAAAPASYVEFQFNAVAGKPYRLWVRGRAQSDNYLNDSIFLQFSGAVDASAHPIFRTGSTAAAVFSLESCSGQGEQGWGWEDTTYCGNAGAVYFATTGPQTIRIQQREDGLSFDQIVLSPAKYLSTSPGALKNDAVVVKK